MLYFRHDMVKSMRAAKLRSIRGRPYGQVSLLEFQRAFPDERACYDFLARQVWPDGFVCPRCQGRRGAFVATRADYLCQGCRRHTSLTAGTIFPKSEVPLHLWFWLIFLMATHKKRVPALYAQKVLGLKSYQTAWLMRRKGRRIVTILFTHHIGGPETQQPSGDRRPQRAVAFARQESSTSRHRYPRRVSRRGTLLNQAGQYLSCEGKVKVEGKGQPSLSAE